MTFQFPPTPSLNQEVFADNGFTYRWDGVKWLTIGGGGLAGGDAPDDGKTYGRKDFEWSEALPIAGGTLTGGLAVAPTSGVAEIDLDKAASGSVTQITARTGATLRWVIQPGNNVAEGLGNVGSNFQVDRYDNAGGHLGTPIQINRASGIVTVTAPLTTARGFQVRDGGGPQVQIACPAGHNAHIEYAPGGVRSWQLGAHLDNIFRLQDNTALRGRLMVTPDGTVQTDNSCNFWAGNEIQAAWNLVVGGGGARIGGQIDVTGAIIPANNNSFWCGENWTPRAWFGVVTYNLVNLSARSEKKDIAPLASVLDRIKALCPVTFHWNKERETDRRHHGFVADEVRAAMGDGFAGVTENKNGESSGVAYSELVAVLWRGVQELTDKLAALESNHANADS